MGKAFAALFSASVILGVYSATAQDVINPGSTVQGDVLRGEGVFLKGAAWYELNSAKAREIDDRRVRENERFYRESLDLYLRDKAANEARDRALRSASTENARRNYEAREVRLRTNPNSTEIQKGQALNALLIDLSDTTISPSSWRGAQVPLPPDVSIGNLVFRLAGQMGDRGAKATSGNLIALGSLDPKNWPKILQEDDLAPERLAYEKVYSKIIADSVAGKLSYKVVPELTKAVDKLSQKVKAVVPAANGFREKAVQEVGKIKSATTMFNGASYDYTQEMIADTTTHKAVTVGELLAFMRKYRLVFASAESNPHVGEMYRELYGLMREQKDRLGMKATVARNGSPVQADVVDAFQPGSVWTGEGTRMLTVLERGQGRFKAKFETVPHFVRMVEGTIEGDRFAWYGRDVVVVRGGPGDDNFGEIRGEVLDITWKKDGATRGTFTLRLKK